MTVAEQRRRDRDLSSGKWSSDNLGDRRDVRNHAFCRFAFLGLPVMTEWYALVRDDDVFLQERCGSKAGCRRHH